MSKTKASNTEPTIEEQLIEMEAEHKLKLETRRRELILREELFKATGLRFMVCIHTGKKESTSIWIENSRFNLRGDEFNPFVIAKYYKGLKKVLGRPKAHVMRFASKDPIKTFAPGYFEVDNNTSEIVHSHPQTLSLCFTFHSDVTVKFKMLWHNGYITENKCYGYFEAKPHNKVDKMGKSYYWVSGFEYIHYYGHHMVTYCPSASDSKRFMKLLTEGDLKR